MPAWTIPWNSASSTVDPYFANVVLLLHGEGDTIVDSSASAHTLTANGTVATSATQAMFGSKSIYFDGAAGNSLELGTSTDWAWGASDWTVEWFSYIPSFPGTQIVFDNRISDAGGVGIYAGTVIHGDKLVVYLVGSTALVASSTIPTNTQTHLAVTRSGDTIRGFMAGVEVLSGTDSRSYATTARAASIGSTPSGTFNYLGYLDEVRITVGEARYTAGFTPPTAAFPDE